MAKGRTLAISDVHGGYKALLQVFEMAEVDFDNDKLIVIGDVCDGWPQVKECFIEIMKFKNLIYIEGNHDEWALEFYKTGIEPEMWYYQGGHGTIESFGNKMPKDILELLSDAPSYYIENNMLFVHGGFDPDFPIENHSRTHLLWDRDLIRTALYESNMDKKAGRADRTALSKYDKVFIGHTPTLNFEDTTVPMTLFEITLIDTGASYDGPLSLVDVNTGKYWQSDPVHELYKGLSARGHYRN